jgi:hypothetical protein
VAQVLIRAEEAARVSIRAKEEEAAVGSHRTEEAVDLAVARRRAWARRWGGTRRRSRWRAESSGGPQRHWRAH